MSLNCLSVTGVVTASGKFSISYRPQGVVNVLHGDVQGYCREKELPCREIVEGMKDKGIFEKVKEWQPDMFLVAGWHHMVLQPWLEYAPAYGLHVFLLLDYSGGVLPGLGHDQRRKRNRHHQFSVC